VSSDVIAEREISGAELVDSIIGSENNKAIGFNETKEDIDSTDSDDNMPSGFGSRFLDQASSSNKELR